MAKELPYFRWYPADAESDEYYASLTDQELGFFHRCLNKSWSNEGLPSDLSELAKIMKVTRRYLDRVWGKVGRKWELRDGRLLNPRQEEERDHAISKSEKNRRIGNANAIKKNANAISTQRERVSEKRVENANGSQQARARAESESESESLTSVSDKEIPGEKLLDSVFVPARSVVDGFRADPNTHAVVPAGAVVSMRTVERFREWISVWGRVPSEEQAARAWASSITDATVSAAFACRDRYAASEDAARGVWQNPDRFIYEQSQGGWNGRWPAARSKSPEVSPRTTQVAENLRRLQQVRNV